MSVKIYLHQIHRQFTNGLSVVEVKGTTVRDCLSHLIKQYPAMGEVLFNKMNQLHDTVMVFVNETIAYPDDLARPVSDGDNIHVALMIAGG